ncbi:MAG: anaerobic ribonucleoside-triphosphate reductase activating protein [Saprospiraceae bacterium]|nr:anaerobic ribonucleoside-triphosphate reductase activating protein [Saprospiraceae bacterium]MBP9208694.1 anaerobic ribonucleoside-triphosphate reductase activating protein [Saprospiraceae bacterium]
MNAAILWSIRVSNPVYHITPFTLLDYPDKTACIVWFAGCNMRCRYCYNVDIVRGKGKMSYDEVLAFLDKRRGLLDAVVLSGGECLMHAHIETFIREIRQRNMLVKIDTNGSNPKALARLIGEGLVDYVALDFKALEDRFYDITQSDLFRPFEKSLELLIASPAVRFEVRTTYHSSLMDEAYIKKMAAYLKEKGYQGTYYLQQFFNDTETLDKMENDYCRLKSQQFEEAAVQMAIRN